MNKALTSLYLCMRVLTAGSVEVRTAVVELFAGLITKTASETVVVCATAAQSWM